MKKRKEQEFEEYEQSAVCLTEVAVLNLTRTLLTISQ